MNIATDKRYKVDLHSHSIISHDGGLSEQDYKKMLGQKIVDYIAITDHNQTVFAQKMHALMGDKIIVGEEIKTTDGEVIGLFLKITIPPGLSAKETMHLIHRQAGLVYIPHPFETVRHGLQSNTLTELVQDIDIVEVFNGRGFLRGKARQAEEFANQHQIAMAAASDAHSFAGVGSPYSVISGIPHHQSMKELLRHGSLHKQFAPFHTYLSPAYNKLKKKLYIPSRFRRGSG